MKVLLIEDDARVADFVVRGLRGEGWTVSHTAEAALGYSLACEDDVDAVILDLSLGSVSSLDLCRRLRTKSMFKPILIFVGSDDLNARLKALRSGADACLAKPFVFDELVERLLALHRRTTAFAVEERPQRLQVGGLAFDRRSHEVTVDGQPIALTSKERELLKLLLSSPGRVFSRERILRTVWSVNEDPLTNVVDVYMARLRKKCGRAADVLETVRGVGYRARSRRGEGCAVDGGSGCKACIGITSSSAWALAAA